MKTFLILAMLFVLAGCQNELSIDDVDGITDLSEAGWEVEEFTFVNQDNEPFSSSELKNDYWIANFIFTSCPTVCLTMTPSMVNLQEAVNSEGLDIQFVSFTVDPDNDTSEVLQDYGERYSVDYSNWNFLTGYHFEEIKALSEGSFRQEVRNDPDSFDIVHGVNFFLVDQQQNIIRMYDGMSTPIEEIIEDIKQLNETT